MRLNKKLYKQILFLFIGIVAFLPTAYSGEKVTISLESLYSDPIAKALRQTLNAYLKGEVVRGKIDSVDSNLHFFKDKFIVLGIQEGGFGGYFVTVMLFSEKMSLWRLWIYQIDEAEYQIREIVKMPLIKEDIKEFAPLRSEKYRKYWL